MGKIENGQDVDVESLDAFFARTPRLAVAFSGGTDSSYLVAAAKRAGVEVRPISCARRSSLLARRPTPSAWLQSRAQS